MPEENQIEPLSTQGLADYHCHCDFSSDAVGTIDEYCQVALKRGLAEICFTTHWDTSPACAGKDDIIRIDGEDKKAIPENLHPYIDAVHAAHEKFYPFGLSVKLGLEYGWFPGCEEKASRLKEQFPFDHFLCGIHELDGLCFCCESQYEACFGRYDVVEAVERYTTQIVAAARSGLFDCIAHLDYLRKYGEGFYGPELNRLLLEKSSPAIFEALRATDTALEVNTSTVRRDLEDFFPHIKMVNAARRAGVRVQFLGSDAHAPQQVAAGFDSAAPLVPDASAAWCED